ncbi:MAG: hypothetical protein LH478_03760 [Chitinophagaceae bacterium]|nr:hypothetical protein [Chitinophagaceae bacterium]
MLAYNKTTLENLAIHEAAEEAADLNLISPQKETEIKTHYMVDLYSPNIFVRIGLGLLTTFIVLSSVGLIGFITNFSSPLVFMIVFAGGCYAVLSYVTATKKHFNSGVDHVLMLATIVFFTGAFLEMMPKGVNEDLLTSAFVGIISLCFFLRFADSIMAIVSFGALVVFIVNVGIYLGTSAKIILPFIMMAFAAVVYFVCKKSKSERMHVYYSKGVFVLQILSVLTFYVAGNYFVVAEFSKEILPGSANTSLPLLFKYFMWAFTVFIPLGYVATGIKYKDVILCRVGILCIAITVLTYRYYYSILPAEAAMVLAGMIICLGAYLLTKYLKKSKGGFIFENVKRRKQETANLEGVIIAETFGQSKATLQQETTFGGGSFGGGGAGERF